jgi:hypothetical protein
VRQDDIDEREWRSRRSWRGGPLGLYASEDDDRAFVPKRHPSLGVTPNLSTGTGVGFLIGVIVFVAVIVWASSTAGSRRAPVEAPVEAPMEAPMEAPPAQVDR